MQMGLTRQRILIIDDQPQDLELAAVLLERELELPQIHQVADAMGFAASLGADPFDLVISERRPAWAEGTSVIHTLRRCFPQAALILFTREADPGDDLATVRIGLDYALAKSSSGFLQLPVVARRLLERAEAGDTGKRSGCDLQRSPVGLFRIDPPDYRVHCLNSACQRLFGLEGNGDRNTPPIPDLLVPGAERDLLLRALELGQPVQELDIPVRAAPGGTLWLRVTLWPVGAGTDTAWEGLCWDARESRRKLRQMSAESERLARSNKELERFAYVVSHDLQQPLGYISRYANLLEDAALQRLDEDGQRYLRRIIEASGRLQEMVDDVLAYSRISSRGEAFSEVDFGLLADAAAEELEDEFTATQGRYRRGKLPLLPADASQIQQLFINLFANALKFRSAAPPRIDLSATDEADHLRFCVADNGIGMRPEDGDRVFEMFQRLHGEEDYPGTGIGLAICRGIVERHGGSIWVESAPGEGSRFWFTIPRGTSAPTNRPEPNHE